MPDFNNLGHYGRWTPFAMFNEYESSLAWSRAQHSGYKNTTSSSVRVLFTEIIQFTDVDGDRTFNPNVDTKVKTYPLSARWLGANPYEAFKYSSTIDPTTNATVYTVSTTTTDGVFKLEYMITTQSGDFQGMPLVPSGMKINVGINNFPFQSVNTSNSELLALKTWVVTDKRGSSSTWRHDDESNDDYDRDRDMNWGNGGRRRLGSLRDARADVSQARIIFGRNATKSFFSWNGTAEVDGFTRTVNSYFDLNAAGGDVMLSNTETAAVLWFTINSDKPGTVLWDPMTGFGASMPTTNPTATVTGMNPVALAVTVMGSIFIVGSVLALYRFRATIAPGVFNSGTEMHVRSVSSAPNKDDYSELLTAKD
jgi:hypothetical protein